jgi:hypothetical protein
MTRRELLKIGLTSGALGAIAPAAMFAGAPVGRHFLHKAIFDERFPTSVSFARAWHRLGAPVHAIRGDVTALWYDDLYFAWKHGPIALAGMTTAESLFCLETLARDAGHRVTSRQTHEDGLVSWAIGPRGGTTNG